MPGPYAKGQAPYAKLFGVKMGPFGPIISYFSVIWPHLGAIWAYFYVNLAFLGLFFLIFKFISFQRKRNLKMKSRRKEFSFLQKENLILEKMGLKMCKNK